MTNTRTPVKTKLEKNLEVKTVLEVVYALKNAAFSVGYHADVFDDLSEDFYSGETLNIGTSLNSVPLKSDGMLWSYLDLIVNLDEWEDEEVDLSRLKGDVSLMLEDAVDFQSIAEDLQERANHACLYLDALKDELSKDKIVLSRQALANAGVRDVVKEVDDE